MTKTIPASSIRKKADPAAQAEAGMVEQRYELHEPPERGLLGNFIHALFGNTTSSHLVTSLVTAAASITGVLVLYGPNQTEADASYIEQQNVRLAKLEEDVDRLLAERSMLRIENAALKAQIDGGINFTDVLCSILEAEPGLNWAKVITPRPLSAEDEQVEFRMACIDSEYKAMFGLGPFEYIGETDFQHWTDQPETAQQFYDNDLFVYQTKRPLHATEEWIGPLGNLRFKGNLVKYYYRFETPDGIPELEFLIGHISKDSIRSAGPAGPR